MEWSREQAEDETQYIQAFFRQKGKDLSEDALQRFMVLTDFLLEYNRHTNLTAITDRLEIAVKHYADSVSPLLYGLIDPAWSVIDVGCGAGFPGLALKIAQPSLALTFLDSTAKKLKFVEMAAERLSFGADFLAGRAEEYGRQQDCRERYDCAVSRAVAELPVLMELCLPFVRPGGRLIAYKSAAAVAAGDSSNELVRARGALSQLSCELEQVLNVPLELPGHDGKQVLSHALVVIKKKGKLSTEYPRRYAQILKKPL